MCRVIAWDGQISLWVKMCVMQCVARDLISAHSISVSAPDHLTSVAPALHQPPVTQGRPVRQSPGRQYSKNDDPALQSQWEARACQANYRPELARPMRGLSLQGQWEARAYKANEWPELARSMRGPSLQGQWEARSQWKACLSRAQWLNGLKQSDSNNTCYTYHSCIMTMNKMSLAVTQLHTLLVYIEMQTDLWLDQFMLSVHTSTI